MLNQQSCDHYVITRKLASRVRGVHGVPSSGSIVTCLRDVQRFSKTADSAQPLTRPLLLGARGLGTRFYHVMRAATSYMHDVHFIRYVWFRYTGRWQQNRNVTLGTYTYSSRPSSVFTPTRNYNVRSMRTRRREKGGYYIGCGGYIQNTPHPFLPPDRPRGSREGACLVRGARSLACAKPHPPNVTVCADKGRGRGSASFRAAARLAFEYVETAWWRRG